MVKRTSWEDRIEVPRLPRPSNVPTTVWSKMGYLQRYNLSKGLLVYDKKTKKCKRSRLGEGRDIPGFLEHVSGVSKPTKTKSVVVPKRLQKKKKKVTKKRKSIHHRDTDPLVMKSGSGSFQFSDNSTYVGEIRNGVLHGNGTRSWVDGSVYTGNWFNGQRHGQGTMLYPTGEEYIGQWKSDTKTGRGTMFRKNGSIFIADWKDNLVIKPYTKKSPNENAYDVYKIYLKLGTYKKVSNVLDIDVAKVRQLVKQYRELKQEELKSAKRKSPKHKNKLHGSPRKIFINTSSVEKLDLTPRLINLLKAQHIYTLKDMTWVTAVDLLRIPNFGNTALKAVEKGLKEYGLRLRSSAEGKQVDIRKLSLQQRRTLRRPGAKRQRQIEKYAKSVSRNYG